MLALRVFEAFDRHGAQNAPPGRRPLASSVCAAVTGSPRAGAPQSNYMKWQHPRNHRGIAEPAARLIQLLLPRRPAFSHRPEPFSPPALGRTWKCWRQTLPVSVPEHLAATTRALNRCWPAARTRSHQPCGHRTHGCAARQLRLVANRWCELLPVPLELKQRLMVARQPALVRLELVGDVLERTGIAPCDTPMAPQRTLLNRILNGPAPPSACSSWPWTPAWACWPCGWHFPCASKPCTNPKECSGWCTPWARCWLFRSSSTWGCTVPFFAIPASTPSSPPARPWRCMGAAADHPAAGPVGRGTLQRRAPQTTDLPAARGIQPRAGVAVACRTARKTSQRLLIYGAGSAGANSRGPDRHTNTCCRALWTTIRRRLGATSMACGYMPRARLRWCSAWT